MEKKREFEEKIIKLFSNRINYTGDKRGKMKPLSEAGIVRNSAEYIFCIPYRLEKYIQKISGWDVPDAAETTLIEPAKIFGFFSLGEIFISDIWQEEIVYLLKSKKDWFLAAISLLNTFGYGYYNVSDYIESDDVISIEVELYNSLESQLYIRWYGKSEIPKCLFSTGVLNSISTLIYRADIMSLPELNIDFYEKIYTSTEQISCKELSCISQTNNNNACLFSIRI